MKQVYVSYLTEVNNHLVLCYIKLTFREKKPKSFMTAELIY
jgi:hypothetical protein